MKPVCIIQIGFSTLKGQNMAGFFFFFLWVWEKEKSFNTADLLHTAVCFTERQVLKDHVQTAQV